MKKPLDKVTEAYYGGMGEDFSQTTRDRIHWVCEQATGEKILDVGCSQGITDIILGREGKKVFAIDMMEESIDFAKKFLEDESVMTKELVEFQVANFMTYDFEDEKFDVIILAEVLEHVTEPIRFLEKARSMLSENGKLIITLPFGINDFFDHKKTYYITGVLEILPSGFKIDEFKFLDNYFCFTLKKGTEGVPLYNLFSEADKKFYIKERMFTQRINRLQKELKDKRNLEKELDELAEALELEQKHSSNLNLALHELKKGRWRKPKVSSTEKRQRSYQVLRNSRLGKAALLAYWRWRKKGKKA